jgi:hypothetical protein
MKFLLLPFACAVSFFIAGRAQSAEPLLAGAAKIDISDYKAGKVNDPCFAKALVLKQGELTAVLVTVDAVAIAEIGHISGKFLPSVRRELESNPGIKPEHVIVNASHCHGVVRSDTDKLVVQAVRDAFKQLTPVKVGAGAAEEKRISENRRLKLKDGSQVDMRRAYALPPDDQVASVGPIDPQVGLLRLDREDGRPLAVVYTFACHPILNPPSKGSSADFPGFASKLLEESLGHNAIAFFVQGCGGDINPVRYKETGLADAEPLGNFLGLSALKGWKSIKVNDEAKLTMRQEMIALPRAADYQQRIAAIEAEQARLLGSLKGTNINFKAFLPLLIQQRMNPVAPATHVQGYLQEKQVERDDLARLDAGNRAEVEAYLANIYVMEQLTRLNTNLALLKKHRAATEAAAVRTLDVEVCALRVGDFKLVTFSGELTVEIGLNIKKAAKDPHAFVVGYTNGYIYYTPTAEQRVNTGYAQEDCDCLVAPEWQRLFEATALEMIGKL